jgi:hypothetical protein
MRPLRTDPLAHMGAPSSHTGRCPWTWRFLRMGRWEVYPASKSLHGLPATPDSSRCLQGLGGPKTCATGQEQQLEGRIYRWPNGTLAAADESFPTTWLSSHVFRDRGTRSETLCWSTYVVFQICSRLGIKVVHVPGYLSGYSFLRSSHPDGVDTPSEVCLDSVPDLGPAGWKSVPLYRSTPWYG